MKTNIRSLISSSALLYLLTGMLVSCSNRQNLKVTDLRCEYLENPLGIDIAQPRFSWHLSGDRRGIYQSAYRILVADKKEDLRNGTGNIWDSKKVSSDKLINIACEGAPLVSDKTYYWSVSVWDQDGEQSQWSEPAIFHTGLFKPEEWKAKWINSADTSLESPLFRKEFKIDKQIETAYAYVSGLGYFEFYLNGEKVGDHVLDPAITNYPVRVLYSTFDVTGQLKKGLNVAGAWLGNGAYHMKQVSNRYSWQSNGAILGYPCLIMQLNITYADGTRESIITDDKWVSSASPITFNNVYGGEDYDARLEKKGWSSAGFDASGWIQTRITDGPGGILQSQLMPPIKVTETIKPVAKTNPHPGVYLFDMGQNYAGWWLMRIKGSEGVTIRIRGAETLNDSLFPRPLQEEDQLSIKQRYHSLVWTDYTIRSNETEIYEPRFFYTGCRYIEVAADNNKNPESLEIEGRVVRSALEFNGKFFTSDSLLNRIHRATVWSQMGNTQGYPSDCPHREKGAYTGDGEIIAEASIHDFQMAAFYTKWLNDMRDAQEENGRIPNTAPTLIGGHGGGIAWGSAYVLIPVWMYQYYNDTRILEEHYATIKRYIEYLHNLAGTDTNPEESYIINDFGTYWFSLGEWCAPGQSDGPNHPMVNTYYYYLDVSLFSRIATILGKNEDAIRYQGLADTIKTELNKKFFNPETNLYGTDTTYQTYQLLALAGEIVPEGHQEQVFRTVIDDIMNKHKGHLNTGIIGTKHLWYVMGHNDRNDLAYTVATSTTYPGYGFWLKNGATTLWEEWNGKNSHNHQMFGSVDEFFYKYLAGIRAPSDEITSTGYKHIHIQPYVPEGLSFVEASLLTAAGKIESEWHNESDLFQLRVVIPPNSDATVSINLINGRDVKVSEKGKKVWQDGAFVPGNPGITNAVLNGTLLTLSTGSGTYNFKVSGM